MTSIHNVLRAIVLLAALTFHAGNHALTFDFDGYEGVLDTNTITLEYGTFTGELGLFADGRPQLGFPDSGSICGTNAAMSNCEGNLWLEFVMPMMDLTFDSFVFNEGDETTISIFNGDTLLASQTIMSNTFIDFTGFSGITSVLFDDSSTGAGFRYGNFFFEPSPVPVPAALPLLLSSLGVLGLWRRRSPAAA